MNTEEFTKDQLQMIDWCTDVAMDSCLSEGKEYKDAVICWIKAYVLKPNQTQDSIVDGAFSKTNQYFEGDDDYSYLDQFEGGRTSTQQVHTDHNDYNYDILDDEDDNENIDKDDY
tara:strand:+ start:32 stop:376 length:345 start_codon:yes stop_codon:yes gene_type:complete